VLELSRATVRDPLAEGRQLPTTRQGPRAPTRTLLTLLRPTTRPVDQPPTHPKGGSHFQPAKGGDFSTGPDKPRIAGLARPTQSSAPRRRGRCGPFRGAVKGSPRYQRGQQRANVGTWELSLSAIGIDHRSAASRSRPGEGSTARCAVDARSARASAAGMECGGSSKRPTARPHWQLPPYVAERAIAEEVREVPLP
jgi:hypothetical protein